MSVTRPLPQDFGPDASEALIADILETVRPLTMVADAAVRFTIEQVIRAIRREIPGVFVECGVWRGGCSIAMLLTQRALLGRIDHPVYLFDSFEGLPLAKEADGPLAAQWQEAADSPNYFDNCRAELEQVQQALTSLGFQSGEYHIVPGWFDQTTVRRRADLESSRIAILRLDGDWYDSTRVCLEQLTPAVSENAVVILDDYYAWDGCARALHEYLARHDLPYRVRSLPRFCGAYFVKKPHRDQPDRLDDGVELDNADVADSQRTVSELRARIVQIERSASEQHAWLADIQASNAWLNEQRARWEQTAGDQAKVIAEQQDWLASLQAANAWLSEQRASWERVAVDQANKLAAEQQGPTDPPQRVPDA